jgi:hypothetical protein
MSKRHIPKRHLAWQANSPVLRAACGLPQPARWSLLASEVTCGACAKTLKMADAEIRERQSKGATVYPMTSGPPGGDPVPREFPSLTDVEDFLGEINTSITTSTKGVHL